jgi:hypothetical protein
MGRIAWLHFVSEPRVVYFQQFGLWLVAGLVAAILFARRRPLSPLALALLCSCAAFAAIPALRRYAR